MSVFKPYLIVMVKQGEHTFIGETISFPTSNGKSIMVRKVPGHPGTMVEMLCADLTVLPQRRRYFVHYAKVEGALSFPTDMLRREHAVTLNFDAETLMIDATHGSSDHLIAKVSSWRDPMWNLERWQSFGWRCEALNTIRWGEETL
jgi:hypothetical protein